MQAQPLSYSQWLDTNERKPSDPLGSIRSYSDYLRLEFDRAGELTPDLDQQIESNAFRSALDKGLLTGDTEEEQINQFTQRGYTSRDVELVNQYGSGIDDETRKSLAEYRDIESRFLSGESDAGTALAALQERISGVMTIESIADARRSAVRNGELLAATYTDADGNLQIEAAPNISEIDDDLLRDSIRNNLSSFDTRALALLRAKKQKVAGLDVNAFDYERKQIGVQAVAEIAKGDSEIADMLEELRAAQAGGFFRKTTEFFGIDDTEQELIEQAANLVANALPNDHDVNDARDYVTDFLKLTGDRPYDKSDPAGSFQRLSTGEILAPTALLFRQKEHDAAVDKLDVSPEAKRRAKSNRIVQRDSMLPTIIETATEADDKFADYLAKANASGIETGEAVEKWFSDDKNYSGTLNRLETVGRGALVDGVLGLFLYPAAMLGVDSARELVMNSQKENAANRKYAQLFGDEFGLGIDIATNVIPIGIDIAVSLVAGSVTAGTGAAAYLGGKAALKAGARAELRNLMKRSGAQKLAELSMKEANQIARETISRTARKRAVAEIKKAGNLKVNGKQIISQVAQDYAQSVGRGTMYSTAFIRSGGGQFLSTYEALEQQTNPDGTPKFSASEIHSNALAAGMVSGLVTVGIMRGFEWLGLEGLEKITTRGLTLQQMRGIWKKQAELAKKTGEKLAGATGAADATLIRESFEETLKESVKQTALNIAGAYGKQAGGEAAEEAIDEFTNSMVGDLFSRQNVDVARALHSGFVASVYGFAFGAVGGLRYVGLTEEIDPVTRLSSEIREAVGVQEQIYTGVADRLQSAGLQRAADSMRERLAVTRQTGVSVSTQVTEELNAAEEQRALREQSDFILDDDGARAKPRRQFEFADRDTRTITIGSTPYSIPADLSGARVEVSPTGQVERITFFDIERADTGTTRQELTIVDPDAINELTAYYRTSNPQSYADIVAAANPAQPAPAANELLATSDGEQTFNQAMNALSDRTVEIIDFVNTGSSYVGDTRKKLRNDPIYRRQFAGFSDAELITAQDELDAAAAIIGSQNIVTERTLDDGTVVKTDIKNWLDTAAQELETDIRNRDRTQSDQRRAAEKAMQRERQPLAPFGVEIRTSDNGQLLLLPDEYAMRPNETPQQTQERVAASFRNQIELFELSLDRRLLRSEAIQLLQTARTLANAVESSAEIEMEFAAISVTDLPPHQAKLVQTIQQSLDESAETGDDVNTVIQRRIEQEYGSIGDAEAANAMKGASPKFINDTHESIFNHYANSGKLPDRGTLETVLRDFGFGGEQYVRTFHDKLKARIKRTGKTAVAVDAADVPALFYGTTESPTAQFKSGSAAQEFDFDAQRAIELMPMASPLSLRYDALANERIANAAKAEVRRLINEKHSQLTSTTKDTRKLELGETIKPLEIARRIAADVNQQAYQRSVNSINSTAAATTAPDVTIGKLDVIVTEAGGVYRAIQSRRAEINILASRLGIKKPQSLNEDALADRLQRELDNAQMTQDTLFSVSGVADHTTNQDGPISEAQRKRAEENRKANGKQRAEYGLEGDVATALRKIAETHPNLRYRKIAEFLLKAYEAGALGNVTVEFIDDITRGFAGAIDLNSRRVYLNMADNNGRGLVDAYLHEMLHAATAHAVANPSSDAMRNALVELDQLREALLQRALIYDEIDSAQLVEALTKTDEFITYLFTDPKLNALVSRIGFDDAPLYKRIWRAIANLFGVKVDGKLESAMQKLMSFSDMAIEQPYGEPANGFLYSISKAERNRLMKQLDDMLSNMDDDDLAGNYDRLFNYASSTIESTKKGVVSSTGAVADLLEIEYKSRGLDKLLSSKISGKANEALRNKLVDYLTARTISEASKHLETRGGSLNWYTDKIEKANALAKKIWPELDNDAAAANTLLGTAEYNQTLFTLILAVTSLNNNPTVNAKSASAVFDSYLQNGVLDSNLAVGAKKDEITNKLDQINDMLAEVRSGRVDFGDVQTFLNKPFTEGTSAQKSKQIKAEAKRLGLPTGDDSKNLASGFNGTLYGSIVFGAKLGHGFYTNLRGVYDPITIDLWMRRMYGRWTGDVKGDLTADKVAAVIHQLVKGEGFADSLIEYVDADGVARVTSGVLSVDENGVVSVTTEYDGNTSTTTLPVSRDQLTVTPLWPRNKRERAAFQRQLKVEFPEMPAKLRDAIKRRGYTRSIEQKKKTTAVVFTATNPRSIEQLFSVDTESGREMRAMLLEYSKRLVSVWNKAFYTPNKDKFGKPSKGKAAKPRWAALANSVITSIDSPTDVPTASQRGIMEEVFNRVSAEMGIDPANLQALMWYPEKYLWDELRGEKTRTDVSYDEALVEVAESKGLDADQLRTEIGIATRYSIGADAEGLRFRDFFATVTSGADPKYQPDLTNYTPVMPLAGGAADFQNTRYRFKGNFDDHIMSSIPAFDEVQAATGSAIERTFDQADVLDIGASEGAWIKALGERSGGRIGGVALDPNPAMRRTFEEKGSAPNVEFSMTAFVAPADYGREMWVEGNEPIVGYDPKGRKFDVVHEAMVFQFLGGDRAAHLDRVVPLLKPDGIVLLEEKFNQPDGIYKFNEDYKNEWKSQFYTAEQLQSKDRDVLAESDRKAAGMRDNQIDVDRFEQELASRFAHVYQYWDSGNFRGYVAGNDANTVEKFIANLDVTPHRFETQPVPRRVEVEGVRYSISGAAVSAGRDTARFNELTADLYAGNPEPSAEDIAAWKEANPEKWVELSEMRERVLREAGYDVKAYHAGTSESIAEFFPLSHFGSDTRQLEGIKNRRENLKETLASSTYTVFLNLKNPKRVEDTWQWGKKMAEAVSEGHDGLIYKNYGEGFNTDEGAVFLDSYVPASPTQIKSADPISPGPKVTPDQWGDTGSMDIRYSISEGAPDYAALYSANTEEEQAAVASGNRSKRNPILTVAAVRLANGEITVEDYADAVDAIDPYTRKGVENAPSLEDIFKFISSSKKERVGVEVPVGKLVEARIDIPTFMSSSKAGTPVYAVTLHEPVSKNATRVGEPISYLPFAHLRNPEMTTRSISGKGGAIRIAAGAGKTPLATVAGELVSTTEIPSDIGEWAEVAYNPVRSSEFRDVINRRVVIGGEEAVSLGSRVYVKNPVYGAEPTGFIAAGTPEADIRYSISETANASIAGRAARANSEGRAGAKPSSYRTTDPLSDIPNMIELADKGWSDQTNFTVPLFSVGTVLDEVGSFWKTLPNRLGNNMTNEMRQLIASRESAISTILYDIERWHKQFDRLYKLAAADVNIDTVNTALGTIEDAVTEAERATASANADAARAALAASKPAATATDLQNEFNRVYYAEVAAYRRANNARRATDQQKAIDDIRIKGHDKLADLIEEMRGLIDRESEAIRDGLGKSMAAVIDDNLGLYLTRTYKIFTSEAWSRAARGQLGTATIRDDAGNPIDFDKLRADAAVSYRAEVVAEATKRGVTLTPAEIDARTLDKLDEYLNALLDGGSPSTSVSVRQELGSLMPRSGINDQFKALLGMETDPLRNAARTLQRAAMMNVNEGFTQQMADLLSVTMGVATKDPAVARAKGYEPIFVTDPNNRSYGALAGMYAEPTVAAALRAEFGNGRQLRSETEKLIGGAGKALSFLSGLSLTAKTLGSVGFYTRNFVSSRLFFMPMQGLLWTKGFGSGYRLAKNAFFTGKTDAATAEDVRTLIGLGLVRDEAQGRAIMDVFRGYADNPETALDRQMKAIDAATSGSLSTAGKILGLGPKSLEWLVNTGANLNNLMDAAIKIEAFLYEKDTLVKAGVTGDLDQQAADIVKRTFPTHSQLYPVVKSFNRSTAALLIAPFARFKAETVRVMVNTVRQAMSEMRSGNPTLVRRGIQRGIGAAFTTVGMSTALAFFYSAAFKMLVGDGEEEEGKFVPLEGDALHAVRQALPTWQRGNDVLLKIGKESIAVLDMTYINPFSLVADPVKLAIDAATGEVSPKLFAGYLTGQLIGEQIAAGTALELLNNRDDRGNPIWLETDSVGDVTRKIFTHYLGGAVEPAVWTKGKQFAEQVDQERIAAASEIVLGELIGARPRRFTNEDIAYRTMRDAKVTLDTARGQLSRLNSARDIPTDTVAEIVNEYQVNNDRVQRELYRRIVGLREAGFDPDMVREKATLAGFSKARVADAEAGVNARWLGGRTYFRDLSKKISDDTVLNKRIDDIAAALADVDPLVEVNSPE